MIRSTALYLTEELRLFNGVAISLLTRHEARGSVGHRTVITGGIDGTAAARQAASGTAKASASWPTTLWLSGTGVDAAELTACSAFHILDTGNAVAARRRCSAFKKRWQRQGEGEVTDGARTAVRRQAPNSLRRETEEPSHCSASQRAAITYYRH